ncbi:hypothetical protein GCM10009720_25850 [Yaniella flava]|uniref:Helix-turn-helix domain-containing protein n=1 Tax=Yaniella flava TaxID=287930 RepID=A0ABP5GDJ6_9MICC
MIHMPDIEKELTLSQVASRLNMSRAHLYRLLDRGEISSHQVGRELRIGLVDLVRFQKRRDRDCEELAQRFSRQASTRAEATGEIAALL